MKEKQNNLHHAKSNIQTSTVVDKLNSCKVNLEKENNILSYMLQYPKFQQTQEVCTISESHVAG